MSGRLDGKVAVITGGASGMGRATVERFVAEGASVVIADFNDVTGKATIDALDAAGHGAAVRFIKTDVSDEDDVAAMVDLAVSTFGRLDVVFNNAGFGGAVGEIDQITLREWNETMAVLVTGVFLGTKHAVRVMRAQGEGGSIINTSSVAGLTGASGPQAYTTAKHAVIGLTRATACELGPLMIRVNAICPGGINTPLINAGNPEAANERLRSLQPLATPGLPEHIASTALFLASDDAAFVTGEALVVDGGFVPVGQDLFGSSARALTGGHTGISRGSTGQESDFRPVES